MKKIIIFLSFYFFSLPAFSILALTDSGPGFGFNEDPAITNLKHLNNVLQEFTRNKTISIKLYNRTKASMLEILLVIKNFNPPLLFTNPELNHIGSNKGEAFYNRDLTNVEIVSTWKMSKTERKKQIKSIEIVLARILTQHHSFILFNKIQKPAFKILREIIKIQGLSFESYNLFSGDTIEVLPYKLRMNIFSLLQLEEQRGGCKDSF